MMSYTYKFPFLLGNTKPIDIFDDQQNHIGSFQRYHRNTFQKIIDRVMGSDFIIHVSARDMTGEYTFEITENMDMKSWLRSSWRGRSTCLGEFKLYDKSKIKTHPRMELHTNSGKQYFISKDLGNKSVLMKNQTGHLFAEATYDKIIPPQTIMIQQFSEELHYIDVAVLYYIMHIRY